MAEPRLKFGNLAWAPRALAVISCALALLAAQPMVHAGTLKTRAVVMRESGVGADPALGEAITRRPAAMAAGARVEMRGERTLLGSASRLHILATMEILHRLLVSELQAPERQLLQVVWFEPLCVMTLPAPAMQRPRSAGQLFTPPPIIERAFAIEHCLLAPPQA